MNKTKRTGLLLSLLLLTFLIPSTYAYAAELAAPAVPASSTFRAVWVASVANLDFPSKKGLTDREMKNEIDALCDRAVALGLNAVIVQVRPAADALYRSSLFPWSEVLTGTQGQAPPNGFDPLAYWVERGHAKGLQVHAWINPFRITSTAQGKTNVQQLAQSHPARQNPSWAITYKNALYFDPGRPECRQLIADGVAEILRNYEVDGIHLDDYFYPGTDFPDDASYIQFGGGADRGEWRRENINTLIRLIQQTVRDIKPEASYGVSPFAIWQNKSSDARGSETRGNETYKTAFADTRRWVKEGLLDYICPQIYWHIGYEIADYEKILRWWEDVCAGTGVKLYIGHAAYKEAESYSGWPAVGEIVRQLTMNAKSNVVSGSVFFRMASLSGSVGDQIRTYYAANPVKNDAPINKTPIIPIPDSASTVPASNPVVTNAVPAPVIPAVVIDTLSVAQPSGSATVNDATGYNILGTCNPNKPLYVNGQPVTNRNAQGFFSYYALLSKGENRFTFTQEGQTAVTRVITLKDAAIKYPDAMKTASVTNAYPNVDEMASAGDSITLKCTAPAGAKVSVKINGTTLTLSQTNPSIKNNDSTLYAASFSGVYTLPSSSPGMITDLGKPVYTMEYNGKTDRATAKASVKIIGADTPYYATVTASSAWVYPKATTNGGSSWQVLAGQKDRVTAMTSNGEWVRLASGGWVEAVNAVIATENALPLNTLSDGRYITGTNEDILLWTASAYPAVTADYDGKQITLRFGLQKSAPGHAVNVANTMFENIGISIDSGAPCYYLTLREGVRLEGFYVDYADGNLRLHLKKRKSLSTGGLPLAGFTFVIDAGHGGSDTGALGPMGAALPEKAINFSNAQKLASRLSGLGATVITTRSADTELSLYERNEINRRANPDLFISMHSNSMAETTNTYEIRGLTVWYRNATSLSLADSLAKDLFNVNPLTTRRPLSNQSNFNVCRPVWTPSVIVEASFICNVDDFAWLIDDARQNNLADRVVNALLNYYK